MPVDSSSIVSRFAELSPQERVDLAQQVAVDLEEHTAESLLSWLRDTGEIGEYTRQDVRRWTSVRYRYLTGRLSEQTG